MKSPVQFVAEVSSNHQGNKARCMRFIEESARIGCSAVKFQMFRIRELFAPEILECSTEHRQRADWELPPQFIRDLAVHCRAHGIEFGCTPFYLEAVKELEEHVDFFKIASYELLWDDLLRACAATSKPVVLATGMATLEETARATAVLREAGCNRLTLLHCVSGYPTPANEANLSAIETIRQTCRCPVGWSDHTVSPSVIYRAVHRWSASMVEFHLDLDGHGAEFGAGHCWLPDQIEPVIHGTLSGFETDGTGNKLPAPSESSDRAWRADPEDGLRPMKDTRAAFCRANTTPSQPLNAKP